MPKSSSPKKESNKKGSPKKGSDKSPKKGSDKNSKKDKSPKIVELTEEEIKKCPITHVIFDLDGVLVNSLECFELFVNKLIWPYDHAYMPMLLKEKIVNRKIERAGKMIIKDLYLPMTVPEFIGYHKDAKPDILRNVELMPGVSRLVEYFRSHKMPMSVVTDSNEEAYNYKMSRHKLIFDKFSHCVCYGTDAEAGKPRPAPDIYELAASRFKDNTPGCSYNILVFEDTSKGVDAAIAAHMKVIWVPDPRVDTSQHNFYDHLMVIKSLETFQPQLWGLPYFSDLYTI